MSEIDATSGWNKPRNTLHAKPSAKDYSSSLRGIVAGIIVVVLFGIVAWFFLPKDVWLSKHDNTHSQENDERKVIAHKKNVAGRENIRSTTATEHEHLAKDVVAFATETEAKTAIDTNITATAKKDNPKRLFTNPMDQLLSMVAPREIGDSVPPVPINDDVQFTPEQEKQMFEQMVAEDDDSDEAIRRKEIVQAMRDEYADLKKNRGWKFVDYIKALEAKAQLDNEILVESSKIHETVFNDPNISDEKYLEALEKINKVLGARGIKPIMPPSCDGKNSNDDVTITTGEIQ